MLLILRHAEATSNVEQGQGYIRREGDEYPLTQKGIQQAQACGGYWARFLTQHGLQTGIDRVSFVSSPATRAQQTISIVQKAFESTLISGAKPNDIDPRLRERRWGIWEGKKESDVMTSEIKDQMDHSRGSFRPPNGDSVQDIQDNTQKWLEDLAISPNALIVACSHGFTIRTILANLFEIHAGDIHTKTIKEVAGIYNAGGILLSPYEKDRSKIIVHDERNPSYLSDSLKTK